MKRIFVTGATGMLGRALLHLAPKAYELSASYFQNKPSHHCSKKIKYYPLNICNRKEVFNILEQAKPDVIIHAASNGNVDFCEKNKDQATNVNVAGISHVVEYCREFHVKLVGFSSNAVFSGTTPPYAESDSLSPINFYGKTKAKGDKIILDSLEDAALLRPITMYGWHDVNTRMNPATFFLSALKKGQKIKVVDDVYNNFLYLEDCIDAVWKVILQNKVGLYHIAGPEKLSRFAFAQKVAEVFGYDTALIHPCLSQAFTNLAPRPLDTTLAISKIVQALGFKPKTVEEGLRHMVRMRTSQKEKLCEYC